MTVRIQLSSRQRKALDDLRKDRNTQTKEQLQVSNFVAPEYIIMKEFHWSSSHCLIGLRDGHPCARNHGHNYCAIVVLRATQLNDVGFVVDYGELSPVKDFIDKRWDHKFIASSEEQLERFNVPSSEAYVLGCQTSAENMARHLYSIFKDEFPLHEVRISETPKTWAIYREKSI